MSSETAKAAEYLPSFCTEYASAAGAQFRLECPQLGQEEAEAMAAGTPPMYEALWVNDLLRELPWRVCASRPVGGDAHINIRELRAALRHGIAEVGMRRSLKLMVLDSRVAGGAMGKGRSAGRLLNAELRAVLPEILGRDLYLGFLFGPSRLNPGDPPSRLRDLPHGPRSSPLTALSATPVRGPAPRARTSICACTALSRR